jgi:hypothetical protein
MRYSCRVSKRGQIGNDRVVALAAADNPPLNSNACWYLKSNMYSNAEDAVT